MVYELVYHGPQIQARRLDFDRVGSSSVETDQTGVVQTFFLSTGHLVHIICGTRNTIRHFDCMARYLKSCTPGRGADLGSSSSESMLPWAGAAEWALEEGVKPTRKREQSRGSGGLLPRENLKYNFFGTARNASKTADSNAKF